MKWLFGPPGVSMDVEIPDKMMPALRLVFINLAWILPLTAVERAADGHPRTAIILGVLTLVDLVIAVKWKHFAVRWGKSMGFALVIAGMLCVAAGVYFVARPAVAKRADSQEINSVASSPPAAPTLTAEAMAPGASLRLLMRPNQDPLELSKDNIWRWFVFRTMEYNDKGEMIGVATFFFITFDRPVQTSYRRVFSPNQPNWHFNVLDLTARSMVVAIANADVSSATVEVQVSGSPL